MTRKESIQSYLPMEYTYALKKYAEKLDKNVTEISRPILMEFVEKNKLLEKFPMGD